jgi:hypothetical protein
VDERTRHHLLTAVENREFARSLLQSVDPSAVALRWCDIAAFYAAVHYVNGYLWERRRFEPSNHDERVAFVSSVEDLRPILNRYIPLMSAGFDARYQPRYRTNPSRVRTRLNDLEAIRVAVLNALQPADAES